VIVVDRSEERFLGDRLRRRIESGGIELRFDSMKADYTLVVGDRVLLVERKSVLDFVSSILEKRLQAQLDEYEYALEEYASQGYKASFILAVVGNTNDKSLFAQEMFLAQRVGRKIPVRSMFLSAMEAYTPLVFQSPTQFVDFLILRHRSYERRAEREASKTEGVATTSTGKIDVGVVYSVDDRVMRRARYAKAASSTDFAVAMLSVVVGEKTAEKLLAVFGSIKELANQDSYRAYMVVKGIGEERAKRLWEALTKRVSFAMEKLA